MLFWEAFSASVQAAFKGSLSFRCTANFCTEEVMNKTRREKTRKKEREKHGEELAFRRHCESLRKNAPSVAVPFFLQNVLHGVARMRP